MPRCPRILSLCRLRWCFGCQWNLPSGWSQPSPWTSRRHHPMLAPRFAGHRRPPPAGPCLKFGRSEPVRHSYWRDRMPFGFGRVCFDFLNSGECPGAPIDSFELSSICFVVVLAFQEGRTPGKSDSQSIHTIPSPPLADLVAASSAAGRISVAVCGTVPRPALACTRRESIASAGNSPQRCSCDGCG